MYIYYGNCHCKYFFLLDCNFTDSLCDTHTSTLKYVEKHKVEYLNFLIKSYFSIQAVFTFNLPINICEEGESKQSKLATLKRQRTCLY